MERQCANCGKTFTVSRRYRRYCSEACRTTIYRNVRSKEKVPKQKKCAFCGKTFMPNSIGHKYCSNDCRLGAWGQRSKDREKICQNCGQPFVSTGTKQIYCSKTCQYNAYQKRRPETERICELCGKPFRTKEDTHFCSEECRTGARRLRQKNRKLNPYMNDPMVQESIKSLIRLELYFGGTPSVKQYMADHSITEELAARLIREVTGGADEER